MIDKMYNKGQYRFMCDKIICGDRKIYTVDEFEKIPRYVTHIYLNNMGLTEIPDLSKFTKLKYLDCSYNNLIVLPNLYDPLQYLDCSFNNLFILPKLNKKLIKLNCCNNKLLSLPKLNKYLKILFCRNNELTTLPKLNNNLVIISCTHNKLIKLPDIPVTNNKLEGFYYGKNPVCDIIKQTFVTRILRSDIQTLNNFIYLYYCLRFKNHFRYWLWSKVRKPKIESYYSPENLRLLLDTMEDINDENEFDVMIESW